MERKVFIKCEWRMITVCIIPFVITICLGSSLTRIFDAFDKHFCVCEKSQRWQPKRIPKNQPSLKIKKTRPLSFPPFCKSSQNLSWDSNSLQKFRVFPAIQKSQVRVSLPSCGPVAENLCWKLVRTVPVWNAATLSAPPASSPGQNSLPFFLD